ncbi:MAG: T9SS type A sorting domain-containing protein, partial [Flavobacteriales bacterium]
IYPNPSNSYFIIESEKTGEYSVISLDGKILFKKTLVAKRLNNVNVLNLKSGVYFVQIKLNTGEIISKRIIKN